jgi:DNA-binding NarL/FixJ family response regulator
MTAIRILLVDDHEVVREGLRHMLSRHDDIEIVGTAATGEEALERAAQLQPDIVVLDLGLPRAQGLDVLTEIRTWHTPPRVLVLTINDDQDIILECVRAGAEGYVLKHTSSQQLAAAIRDVAAGKHYFCEEVIRALVDGDHAVGDGPLLSNRESEVLRLLADGLSNRDIAARMYVTVDTVKTHLGHIYRKLEVESRTHAIVVALQRGMLK